MYQLNLEETQVSTAMVEKRIAELREEINASPVTLEESRAAQETVREFYSDVASRTEGDWDGFMAVCEKTNHANAVDEIAKLENTLAADLMFCPKRYVVTDTPNLTSPAGFPPSSRVFLQTRVAIHTDSLDNLPASNVELHAFDMSKMAA